ELTLRNREDDQLATLHDHLRLKHGNIGQHRFGPITALLRGRADADNGVAGTGERSPQPRADPAGTNDADTQSARLLPIHAGHADASPDRQRWVVSATTDCTVTSATSVKKARAAS